MNREEILASVIEKIMFAEGGYVEVNDIYMVIDVSYVSITKEEAAVLKSIGKNRESD